MKTANNILWLMSQIAKYQRTNVDPTSIAMAQGLLHKELSEQLRKYYQQGA